MSTRKYDVLLSFKSEDPCKDFGDQLYDAFMENEILVYRDDGDTRNYNFHKVYKKSMFSIMIFFYQDYRSLSSRLMEVGHLLTTGINYNFIPIFYKIKDEGLYGAEVHEWRKPLSVATTYYGATFYGWEITETKNGYQSYIGAITEELRKKIREKSPGRRGFQLTWFLEERLAIYWDFNCSPFPTNVNPEDIAKTIIAFLKETKTNWAAVDIYAYGHSSEEQQKKLRSSLAKQNVNLHYSGVTLIHTPRGRKDTTFFALLVDMLKRSHSFPEPSPIMLISANISYANALHALGLLGHKSMLLTSSEVGVSVPLINASVYTCSDVAKGASSSQVQIKELPDDNNNRPGSMLVKRNDLVATSSSQVEELSMRFKDFKSIDPCGIDFFIFWDFENCPIPGEVPTKDVAFNIENFVRGKIGYKIGYFIPRIRAYADFSRINGKVRESLEKSGVKLINTPHVVKKDAADLAMIISLFMYSKLVCPRSSIMLIAGDVDFATTLRAIGFRHDIFLAVPSWVDVSESLTSASKDYWYWSEVAYGIDLTGLKGQLEELLKSNGGQLRLGSLDAEYEKMFEKPLCLSDYKADNLVNLLERMSYMISVEVSKKGKRKSPDGEALVKLKG